MKKLLYVLILMPLFFTTKAQQSGSIGNKTANQHIKHSLNNRIENTSTCKPDSEYWWSADTTTGTHWVFDDKEFFTYDANSNLIDDKFNHFNGSTWVTTRENVFTYNINNNVATDITFYNGMANDKMEYTYNTNDKKTKILELWNYGSGWTNYYLDTFMYDVSNNLISKIEMQWIGNAWVNNTQFTYFYNANNLMIKSYFKTWNNTYWSNIGEDTFIYDVNNNLITDFGKAWSGTTWKNSDSTTNTYDTNNNLTTYNVKTWNGTAWGNWNWYTYTYCNNNCISTWDTKTWDSARNGWKNYDSLITFCSYSTGIKKTILSTKKITVYPNPASTFINIEVGIENEEVKIVDVLGNEVTNEKLKDVNNLQIDVSNLPSGVYLIRTATQGTQKFIKQ